MENLINFFTDNFLNCVWFAVLLVSMIPTFESKIAIPLALNHAIWGNMALKPFTSFVVASIGSIIPCYIILLLTRYFKNRTAGFLIDKHLAKYMLRSKKIEQSKNPFNSYFALSCFTAIPLPLTGVWSASLIAGLTNLNINFAFISISIGAIISSAVTTLICCVFSNSIDIIFLISMIMIIGFITINTVIMSIKSIMKKMKR